MNVTQDLSILSLITNASVLVQLVMALLLMVSFMSWLFIFRKLFAIRQAVVQTDKFERDFWSGSDMNGLYQSAVNDRHRAGALERIFEAGFREFAKLKAQIDQLQHNPPLYLHPSVGAFAKRLAEKGKTVNPDMEYCFFTNSGSENVMN